MSLTIKTYIRRIIQMDQSVMIELQRMEQDLSYYQEQFKVLEQAIHELRILDESLNELEKNKNNELLVNIGRKLFLPVKVQEKSLIVDVGKNTFIKKNIPQTKKIIDEQLVNLIKGKGQLLEQMNTLHKEIEILIAKVENEPQESE